MNCNMELHLIESGDIVCPFCDQFAHFKFTCSVAFSENHGSVTFSENRKSMMSYHGKVPVE